MFYFLYKWWRRDEDDESEDRIVKDDDKTCDVNSYDFIRLHTKKFLNYI